MCVYWGSEKSLEGKLMWRDLCHIVALTQLAKGMFPISCWFHSSLKSTICWPLMDALYWRRRCSPTRHKAIQTTVFNSFCSIFPKLLQPWRSLLIQCLFVTTEKLRMGLLYHKPQTTKVFTGQEPWAPAREVTQRLLGSLFSMIWFYETSRFFFYSKPPSKE